MPTGDPLLGYQATPSQRATVKYFWIVAALLLVQIVLGVVTAHYGVEGDGFYGIPLDRILPYTVARTWHLQLGIFWIATAWLAAGLYIGPAVGGTRAEIPAARRERALRRAARRGPGIDGGRVAERQAGAVERHVVVLLRPQGYEYIDLGRVFQIALLVGLFLWLFLVARAILPALRRNDEQRSILTLFLISSLAIAFFYGAALG